MLSITSFSLGVDWETEDGIESDWTLAGNFTAWEDADEDNPLDSSVKDTVELSGDTELSWIGVDKLLLDTGDCGRSTSKFNITGIVGNWPKGNCSFMSEGDTDSSLLMDESSSCSGSGLLITSEELLLFQDYKNSVRYTLLIHFVITLTIASIVDSASAFHSSTSWLNPFPSSSTSLIVLPWERHSPTFWRRVNTC